METIGPYRRDVSDEEARRSLEGVDRIALLDTAEFLGVTVGGGAGDPVVVFIGWSRELVERAYPGTAIWRAALERYLRSPRTDDPGDAPLRQLATDSLARFPTLERWLSWSDHERVKRASRMAKRRRHRLLFWIDGP